MAETLPADNVPADNVVAIRKRTRWVLIFSVFPAGMGMTATFAATSLAAKEMTDNDALATLAATMTAIGGAAAALPLGAHMADHGRRSGLLRAWTVGTAGAILAFVAVLMQFYPFLLVGVFCVGVGQGASLAARYAAADLAEPQHRARDLGIVMWASSIGSLLGPTIALGGAGWVAINVLGIRELGGPYLMAILTFIIAATVVNTQLRPDPLLLAKEIGSATDVKRPSLGQSFRNLFTHRLAAIAVLAMAVGQGVMVAVMAVTPLHMDDGNHEARVIGLVISLHVVGMYFFSPLVGWVVDRVPSTVMVAAAGVTLFIGAEMASHTDATDRLGVFIGLFLVGLGWSFAMISGAALISAVFDVSERASVQGAADFMMVTSGATGGLLSGVIVEATDYHTLSHWAAVSALLLLIAAALYPTVTRIRPRTPAATAG